MTTVRGPFKQAPTPTEVSKQMQTTRIACLVPLANASIMYKSCSELCGEPARAVAKKESGAESRYALENLKYQITSGLRLNYLKGKLFQTISARYFDRVNLDDYFVLNTRLTWQSGHFRIFANVSNVFDTKYKETNLVEMPGRWASMGLSVDLF